MKRNALIIIDEAQKKMNGYAVLLNYRFMNLCVKAEPASLLPVVVKMEGDVFTFEEVADVAIHQEDQFQVYPKSDSPSLLYAIGKGISEVHPEFKMETKTEKINEEEEIETLIYTMPEVNDDRHDALNDAVSTLSKDASTKIDATFSLYTTKITTVMVNETPEAIDEAKDKLKEIYDWHNDICKQYREAKEKEIDDAYQRYLEKQKTKEEAEKEKDAAQGKNVTSSFKMDKNND